MVESFVVENAYRKHKPFDELYNEYVIRVHPCYNQLIVVWAKMSSVLYSREYNYHASAKKKLLSTAKQAVKSSLFVGK